VAIDFESVLRNIQNLQTRCIPWPPSRDLLPIVMVLILILSTLTSVQSFENVGNVDVMQDRKSLRLQYTRRALR
jgi:hypothetical protein